MCVFLCFLFPVTVQQIRPFYIHSGWLGNVMPSKREYCSTVIVELKNSVQLSMQKHVNDRTVAGIVTTTEANGVLVTKAIVGSVEA